MTREQYVCFLKTAAQAHTNDLKWIAKQERLYRIFVTCWVIGISMSSIGCVMRGWQMDNGNLAINVALALFNIYIRPKHSNHQELRKEAMRYRQLFLRMADHA